MIEIPNHTYVDHIDATVANIRRIEKLKLQDATLGGFENPKKIGNPNSIFSLLKQRRRIVETPSYYDGFEDSKKRIDAFQKTNVWTPADEKSYADGNPLPEAFGVFALVASESIPEAEQDLIYAELLNRALGKAAARSFDVVNIVLHDADPVTPIAEDLGFRPVGPRGEAAGAPGLIQQRFQREV